MTQTSAPLMEIDDVSVHFPIRQGVLQRQFAEVRAVDRVTLTLRKGEAFGLVGESGCGKTTLARLVLRLVDPTGGNLRFDGQEIGELHGADLAFYRKRVSAIFQDPFSSLNPRMKAGAIVAEVLRVNGYAGDLAARVSELFALCGLPERFLTLYPHQMSGGQRQRVGIARALAPEPEMIVCDEAVSALDVSIQAQIINLLADLQRRLGLTYLFIGHDLSVVRHLCDRVAVMYLGKVMETGSTEELFSNPKHPYTRALIDAVPNPDPLLESGREVIALEGEVPSPMDPPSGCVFQTRCPIAMDICRTAVPEPKIIGSDHQAACHAIEN